MMLPNKVGNIMTKKDEPSEQRIVEGNDQYLIHSIQITVDQATKSKITTPRLKDPKNKEEYL